MDWQNLFFPHILERGFNYYQNGYVDDFDAGSDYVQATVQGSEEYEIFIDIVNEEIIEMSCDCPHAYEGNHCKHMAAVLFFLDDEQGKGSERKPVKMDQNTEYRKNSIEALVEEADEETVRKFLVSVLENDEKLSGRFKQILIDEVSPEDIMQIYKKQVDDIVDQYTEKHDFIDYYDASYEEFSFNTELDSFLEKDVQEMLKNKRYMEAFELTKYVILSVENEYMDDFAGGLDILMETCVEIWQEILACCDIVLKREMFDWCMSNLDDFENDYIADCIEQILFNNFSEEEFLERKFKLTQHGILRYKNEKDIWMQEYYAGKWARYHLKLMKAMKLSETEIEEFCKDNVELNSVREYYAKECIQKKDYETAINLLKEGKEKNKEYPGTVADYSMQLKQLYKEIGNQEEYENELWLLMLEHKEGDLEVYRELRDVYSEDVWKEKREIIFKKLSPYVHVDRLYKEDQLYDRLLNLVINTSGTYTLMEYEKCLKDLYPEELLEKYENEVRSMATHPTGRSHYQELVRFLRRMKKYPDGKKAVDKIVTDWKLIYKNRPAMMDELSRL